MVMGEVATCGMSGLLQRRGPPH